MKKGFLFMAIIARAMLTSCGTAVQPDQITVNPNPLCVKGGKVSAEITGKFPAKKFSKKATLVVTPVLKYNGKEALGESMTYVGERVKENGKTVSYRNGGTYTQSASFDFVEEMAISELYLRFEAKKGNKVITIPDVKIADGVNHIVTLVNARDARTQLTADKFQRIIQEMTEADIMFLIQQSDLRGSELRKQEMKDLKAAIKEAKDNDRKEINNIEVAGYASPDGAADLNARLANYRQKNAERHMQSILRQARVKHSIESNMTAEDWAGFQKAMEQSNIQDKELVLRVLSMYADPEEREAQIKNLAAVYKNIADEILPALRRSRLILTTDLIGKSDDEIKECWKNDPKTLNVEELLYAATLYNTDAEKMAIYKKATELYANDCRGFNNLGMGYFKQGNVAEARRCFAQALAVAPNDADVNYNAAIAAMTDGDMKKAEAYLGKAAGTQGDLATATGTFYTLKGDYKKAKSSYGNSNTNNAAIQQILNEDYAAARKTLASVATPNATTAYLKAIVGARTNDREAVYTNMKAAVAQDAQLKVRAQKDIEFAKFTTDSEFMAIVK